MVCGLGFSREKVEHSKILCEKDPLKSIFQWDAEVIRQLKKARFHDSLEEKQLNMVGYLCELFLELGGCVPKKNTSESAGFEAVCRG